MIRNPPPLHLTPPPRKFVKEYSAAINRLALLVIKQQRLSCVHAHIPSLPLSDSAYRASKQTRDASHLSFALLVIKQQRLSCVHAHIPSLPLSDSAYRANKAVPVRSRLCIYVIRMSTRNKTNVCFATACFSFAAATSHPSIRRSRRRHRRTLPLSSHSRQPYPQPRPSPPGCLP